MAEAVTLQSATETAAAPDERRPGRAVIDAALVKLLRDPVGSPVGSPVRSPGGDLADAQEEDWLENRLSAAQGLALGVVLSVPLWSAILWVAYLILR